MAPPVYVLDSKFDEDEFLRDIKVAQRAVGNAGEADARHLQRLVLITRLATVLGYMLLVVAALQPFGLGLTLLCGTIAASAISLARVMSWTIIGHHISHGGYDRVHNLAPGVLPSQYKRGIFAKGLLRRCIDWLDWMLPEAWDQEHNKLHHYHLSEDSDPDLVERNFKILQELPLPLFMKYMSMVFWIFTWKFTYYSPGTFKELQLSKPKSWLSQNWPVNRSKKDPVTLPELLIALPFVSLAKMRPKEFLYWIVFDTMWLLSIAPMMAVVLLPVFLPVAMGSLNAWPFTALPWTVAMRALAVGLVTEAFTNAHSFVIIACNHCGADLYRYSTPCKPYSAEWYLRCAYSSSNFECGTELVDILYGWLNYQAEHHMFPDMTPLQYRKLQPLIKSVFAKHGAMYVQDNGLKRTWKMLQVAVGAKSMKRCTSLLTPRDGGESVLRWLKASGRDGPQVSETMTLIGG